MVDRRRSQTSNKCIVWAQLYLGTTHHGVQAFVIDIRDEPTLNTKQGVILGDCGRKFGGNVIDNGFIIFKNYKVPYDSLLDRIPQITPECVFVTSIPKKVKRMGIMLST